MVRHENRNSRFVAAVAQSIDIVVLLVFSLIDGPPSPSPGRTREREPRSRLLRLRNERVHVRLVTLCRLRLEWDQAFLRPFLFDILPSFSVFFLSSQRKDSFLFKCFSTNLERSIKENRTEVLFDYVNALTRAGAHAFLLRKRENDRPSRSFRDNPPRVLGFSMKGKS